MTILTQSSSDKVIMKLLSTACLSDRHEYCSFSFAGAADCQCSCQK